jgi:putative salt-induced outer membrane protein YdiY
MTPMIPALLLLSTAHAISSDLQATPAPAQTPVVAAPKWTGSVALGASYSDGNTDRRSASATVDTEKRREKDRFTLGFLWRYADDSGILTDRQTQLRGKYDYFFSKKMYGLAQASAEDNFSAALDLRLTAGVGLGYQFKESPSWKIAAEAGLSYVDSDYTGTVDDTAYLAARAAYNWDWKPNTKYNLSQVGEIFPSLERSEDINARVDSKGRVNLTDKMFAQLQWLYQWDNTPATGKVRSDNMVLLGVGWSF